MYKRRVAVIRGGPNDEYAVSMRTGDAILQSLDTNLFEPTDIVVTKNSEWLHNGVVRYPEHLVPTFDVCIIALHGAYGEDGTLQRLLERHSIPYTGSRPYASRMAMHKRYAKEHLRPILSSVPFALPRHTVVTQNSLGMLASVVAGIAQVFGPEYIIKPIASGSSVGVTVVHSPAELQYALETILEKNDEVLVEERIIGREVTCGVIDRFRGVSLYALPPVEVLLPQEATHYDYACKYNGGAYYACPSDLDFETKQAVEESAKSIHEALGLSQYSRSDFIVAADGIYFLEVNTLPDLAPQAPFMQSLAAVGGNDRDFISHLVFDAIGQSARTRMP